LLLFNYFSASNVVAAEIVEEVVAVVGESPILASDLDLAELVGLVPAEPSEGADAHRERLLSARIRLELMLRDLETSGALYRLELDVDGALGSLVAGTPGEAWLRGQLASRGLRWADVEELALRVAAANAFAQQRLRPRIEVSSEEILAAYRDLERQLAAEGEPPPPLGEVSGELHRLLTERELNDEIERWLQQARSRLDVTRFR
jgi:hypothetical protein